MQSIRQRARWLSYGGSGAVRNLYALAALLLLAVLATASGARAESAPLRIVALGDSLTAGYGLRPGEGLVPQLQDWLDARGAGAQLVNAGVSGDTTAGARARLDWVLGEGAGALIVTLGGNDMLRGLPPEQTRANLDAILAELKRRHIRVLLLGMLAPPNLGGAYRAHFDPIYPALAKTYDAALVPFFLQPLMGKPDLVQDDHIHPTVQGIEALVAATVEQVADALPAKGAR